MFDGVFFSLGFINHFLIFFSFELGSYFVDSLLHSFVKFGLVCFWAFSPTLLPLSGLMTHPLFNCLLKMWLLANILVL